ncbi:hypothetical protein DJ568_12890 [Mucilaginibacter hurinus]|uniref:Uncharacterized protein n=1 Tax=Mucilaginibacter hurinus TaxID=2201324 RepID=A0A367GND0_9SPHI|nr:hypothetical protein [Mucilaginibacter hurinus]RCH54193.1 hypothetical protein DJ568_12890 [Mucilaginibacter hurinus]
MENSFTEIMAKQSDAKLIEIINSPDGEYQLTALEAAKNELNSRNLSTDQVFLPNSMSNKKTNRKIRMQTNL